MNDKEKLADIIGICKDAKENTQYVANYPLNDYNDEMTDITYINKILDVIQGWH